MFVPQFTELSAMRREIAFLVVAASMVWCGSLSADDVLLGQIYGNGVHAFNQGDYVSAYNALTSAIKGGTHDPRAYYFRGLAFLRLGREQEAVSDFEKGAELEVGDSANAFPVNRSLERIQGQPRQVLEYYRMTVHAAAVEKQEAARQARYEEPRGRRAKRFAPRATGPVVAECGSRQPPGRATAAGSQARRQSVRCDSANAGAKTCTDGRKETGARQ